MGLMQDMRKLEQELEEQGTTLEEVIRSLLEFGSKVPLFMQRIQDMEELLGELEKLEGMSSDIQDIKKEIIKKYECQSCHNADDLRIQVRCGCGFILQESIQYGS